MSCWSRVGVASVQSEALDDGVCKATAAHWIHFGLHQSGEVIGDLLVLDGCAEPLGDQVGGLLPAEEFQHHHAAQDHGTGVDAIQSCVLGGGAMGGLENGGRFADVGSWSHAKTAHHRSGRIGDVIAIEVEGGQDRILLRAGLDLLEDAVGDAVVHQHHAFPFATAVAIPNRCEHIPHIRINRLFFLGREAVVAGLNHARIVLGAERVIAVEIVENPALTFGNTNIAEFSGG